MTKYLYIFVAVTWLNSESFYLRNPLASGKFAKGILLQCERLPFNKRKTAFCKLKGHH